MRNSHPIIILVFFAVGSLGLASCGGPKKDGLTQPTVKVGVERSLLEVKLSSDSFSVEAASQIISDLLKIRSLQNISKLKSIGGNFRADSFKIKNGMSGVLLWFCYNPHDPEYPEFFLALEQKKYDPYNDPIPIPGKILSVPVTFQYPPRNYDFDTVKNHLINHKASSVTFTNGAINGEKVKEYATNFESLMSIISPDSKDSLYCKYPFSYFEKNSSYDKFMSKKDLALVRYYWGFDSFLKDHKPNYIRTILVGVDRKGSPITASTKDGDPLLQKSTPPPPSN